MYKRQSQRNVNGTAILELRPLSFSTVGVESKDDLVKTKFGEYGEIDVYKRQVYTIQGVATNDFAE